MEYEPQTIAGIIWKLSSLEILSLYLDFPFEPEENVDIIWKEISNHPLKNDKVVEGATKVDAYVVNNDEVKSLYRSQRDKLPQGKSFLRK